MAKLSLHVPLAAADVQPNTMVEWAKRTKAAGLDGLFTLDRLVFDNYEPMLSLAAASAVAPGMILGMSVLLGALRPPTLLAKMAATLERMNGQDVILGLGVGSRADDFAAAEVPFEHRGTRLEEAIQIVKLCWSGHPVKFSGRFYNVDVGPVGPKPSHPLPIWLGGGATESALKRIGRLADGYIASSSGGPNGFRANWDKVRGYAQQAGRDPSGLVPAALVYVLVEDDVSRGEQITASYFEYYYAGRRPGRGGAIIGSAQAVADGIQQYVEAGVEYLIIGFPTAGLPYLDAFLEKVAPRFS